MPCLEFRRVLRSEEHTSELQSHSHLVCRLLLEKKKTYAINYSEQRTQAERWYTHDWAPTPAAYAPLLRSLPRGLSERFARSVALFFFFKEPGPPGNPPFSPPRALLI